MRITWDRTCDMAYVYFAERIEPGGVAETVAAQLHCAVGKPVILNVVKDLL